MTDLKRGEQRGTGRSAGQKPNPRSDDTENRGAEFGATERATRGTNRDFDERGRSANQRHGHPREERD